MKQLKSLTAVVIGSMILVGCGQATSTTSSTASSMAVVTSFSQSYSQLQWGVRSEIKNSRITVSVTNTSANPMTLRFTKTPISGDIAYLAADLSVIATEQIGILSVINEIELAPNDTWAQSIHLQSVPANVSGFSVSIVYQVGSDSAVTDKISLIF